MKTKATTKEEEPEETGSVYYELNIENLTINVAEGGQVIFQSGKPQPPNPPPH